MPAPRRTRPRGSSYAATRTARVREALATCFPDHTFSVRIAGVGTTPAHTHVRWTDGPSRRAVAAAAAVTSVRITYFRSASLPTLVRLALAAPAGITPRELLHRFVTTDATAIDPDGLHARRTELLCALPGLPQALPARPATAAAPELASARLPGGDNELLARAATEIVAATAADSDEVLVIAAVLLADAVVADPRDRERCWVTARALAC